MTTDDDNAVKWFSKLSLKTYKAFKNLYVIEMYKQDMIYDKSLYAGTYILDISKIEMMKLHYEVITKNVEKYNLIYYDIVSCVYPPALSVPFHSLPCTSA